MGIVYTNNFESETVGQLPAGWINTGTANASVVSDSNISGTKVFGQFPSTSGVVGPIALYTGQASVAAQEITFKSRVLAGAGLFTIASPVICADATGQNCYYFVPEQHNFHLGKRVAGVNTDLVAGSDLGYGGLGVGTILCYRLRWQAGVLSAKVWVNGNAEPSSWTATVTDSTFTTGRQGAAFGTSGTNYSNPAYLDEFTVSDLDAGVAATAVTLSGPTTSTVGQESATFTVGANGSITGTLVVTPSDANGGGTFTPTSRSLSSAAPTGTFTYNAGSAGSKTISLANDGGLTNPASIALTASAPLAGAIAVTDANLFFSPYNWYSNGSGAMQANNVKVGSTYAWSNCRGSYIKFKATVGSSGSIVVNVNTSSLSTIAAQGCPNLIWNINGGPVQTRLLAVGDTSVTLASGLAAGTYEVFFAFRGVWVTQDGGTGNSYSNAANRVQVTSIQLSAGGSLVAPTLRPKRLVVWGDSITEADINISGTRSGSSQDSTQSYGYFLAQALNAEVGIIGWYGQTWSFFNGSWSNYSDSNSRLVGGLLLPAPDYAVITFGENDGATGPDPATIASYIAPVAAALPTSKIFLNVPFSGKGRANLTAATRPSNVALVDVAAYEFLPGCLMWSFDGQHPNVQGHAMLGARLSSAINLASGTGGAAGAMSFGPFALTSTGQLVAVFG